MAPPARDPVRPRAVRNRLVALLAVNSGATDAVSFLALGGVFSSVMTGNMALLGLSVSRLDGALAARSVIALVGYIAGCVVAGRITGSPRRDDPVWPRRITWALGVEFAILAAVSAGWVLAGGRPDGSAEPPLLCANAFALGIQSGAIYGLGVSGLSSTYFTGTLTTLVIHTIARRERPRAARRNATVLVGLIGGAAIAAALVIYLPPLVPVVQLGTVGTVLVVVNTRTDLSSAPLTRRGSAPRRA